MGFGCRPIAKHAHYFLFDKEKDRPRAMRSAHIGYKDQIRTIANVSPMSILGLLLLHFGTVSSDLSPLLLQG